MASTKADTLPISENLIENPRLMYARWNTAVLQWATNNSITGFEIQHQLLTDVEWEIRFPPVAGVPIPRLPEFPPRFAGNANAAIIANWKYDTEITASVEALVKQFKSAILVSLGPAIEREFADPLRGHIDHSIHQIMDLVRTGYGTVTEADILRLKENMIIDETKSWRENIGKLRSIFTLLAPVGHYTTDFDKRSALDNAIAKTKFAPLLEAYKNETPLLANRTFDQQCTYIELREPNISASAAGFAGKVEAAVAAITSAQEAKIAALTATVAALTANPAAATAAVQAPNHAGQGGRGGRGGRGGGRNHERSAGRGKPRPYCFEHGYVGHPGTICT